MASQLPEETRREIGQHFICGFHGYEVSQDIRTLIEHYYLGRWRSSSGEADPKPPAHIDIGAVILFKRNIKDIKQVRGLICDLQQIAKETGHKMPLLIGIDQENGLVSAFNSPSSSVDVGTQFPGAMAQAAIGSLEITNLIGQATARELKFAGINWAFSPVADVNCDPRNPVIGVRSFGDDPVEVANYASAASSGLITGGVATSSKHFPGHGDTNVDSHLALPKIMKTRSELDHMELVPFKRLVDDKIPTIMTGHMALPLVNKDDTPCSLSANITTSLLREELAYNGVIVTDCMEMDAVAETYTSQKGAVRSLEAGADIAMICHTMERQRGAIELAYDWLAEGKLSMTTLLSSGRRIDALKSRFTGAWDVVLRREIDEAEWSTLKTASSILSQRAYKSSTALLDPKLPFTPLRRDLGSVLVFTPEIESLNKAVDDAEGVLRSGDGADMPIRNTAGPSYSAFAKSIAQRVKSEHVVYLKTDRDLSRYTEALRDASTVIFVTRNADRSDWQISCLRDALTRVQDTPVIILASCTPYDLFNAQDLQVPCIATFEYTPPAMECAAAVLFGEQKILGHVPVHVHPGPS